MRLSKACFVFSIRFLQSAGCIPEGPYGFGDWLVDRGKQWNRADQCYMHLMSKETQPAVRDLAELQHSHSALLNEFATQSENLAVSRALVADIQEMSKVDNQPEIRSQQRQIAALRLQVESMRPYK